MGFLAFLPRWRHRAGYRVPTMDQTHDNGHSVAPTQPPWRERLVHRLGGTMPERGLSYDKA